MKLKSTVLLVLAFTVAVGEVGIHFNEITGLVPRSLSAKFLKARLALKAPEFEIRHVIAAVSKKHHVQEAFIRSIIKAESGGNPAALSNKGAVGLMQLMPTTAEELGADPSIPEQNVEAGTLYFSRLLNRYRSYKHPEVRAIAAYNAGPGFVDKYKGVPPFPETKAYVKRVLSYYKEFSGSAIPYLEEHLRSKRVVLAQRGKVKHVPTLPAGPDLGMPAVAPPPAGDEQTMD